MLAALDAARLRERRFLADASHELRTPVTSLAGNVEFLARHGANPEVLADLQLDTARLQRLVDDLLALERESAGPAPEQPGAPGRDRGRRGGRPRLHAHQRLHAGDRPRRARRAAPRARQPARERRDPRSTRRRGQRLAHGRREGVAALAVRDEGPGLAPGDLEHAFERFWRAPEAAGRPGSGLGLAIVRATAERHGGRVTVDRSTVTVILPA